MGAFFVRSKHRTGFMHRTRDSAGLKCQVLTSDESHGCAGDNSQLLFHIMSASGEPGLLAGILPQIWPRSAGLLTGL